MQTMELLTEAEAAEVLTVSVGTLRAWRGNLKGPRYRKIGHAVRYTPEDLAAFIHSSSVDPETT